MELTWFLSVSGFLWVAAITPGPNNMLLTSSGANFGFLRSLPVMIGIMLGMQTLLLLSAVGVAGLLIAFPSLHMALKIVGSAYLLWIAWKIASSHYEQLQTSRVARPLYFYQAGLLQFLNPKAWLMGLGAIASYSLPGAQYVSSVWLMALVMLSVNLIAGLIWLGFGSAIGRVLRSRTAWFVFNISMGLLTAACVVFIWY